MAWLVLDKNGDELVFKFKPIKNQYGYSGFPFSYITLPKGSIKKLIGRELTWESDPVELK